ncbi:MAG: iron complex transport system substrate-binding protein [Ilumatobacter sp.]|jgi:iron complex transport system substrate-binding protein
MQEIPHLCSVAVMAVLVVTACGSGTETTRQTRTSASSQTEVTADAPNGTSPATITLVANVGQRIVPVDGDLAEIVFALGLGNQVVATDISATYPVAADALPEVGYQRALSAEPILAFEPTIVLATDLAGPGGTLESLARLDVETVIIERESSPAGPGNKIRAVAAAIGADAAGDVLAADVDEQIADATQRASSATTSPRVGVVYLRGDTVQLLFGEGSGVDWLIDAAGGIDIADELGVINNAPINAEALVVSAPDVLIVPQRGLDSVGGLDGLLEIPGIAATPAGQNERILVYDDQLLLGNGPRTGQLLNQMITDIHGDI